MKKMMTKITCICLLIFAMCVNSYAEVTPEPISSDDEVTTTVDPNVTATPESTSGVIMNEISNDISGPAPTEENSDVVVKQPVLDLSQPAPTEENTDGTGTTVAPQTGDSSNVLMLSIAALLSCIVIAACYRKRVNN